MDAALEDECGDPQGVSRLVAALSAHMWSNMSMKDRRHVASAMHTEPAEARQERPLDKEPENLSSKRNSSVEGQQAVVVDTGDVDATDPCAADVTDDLSLVPDDEEEDGEFEQMEAMMAKLAGERERIMHLPDEERRERAASLAIQLMGMMGLDDDDA